jgi:hypothetical protein
VIEAEICEETKERTDFELEDILAGGADDLDSFRFQEFDDTIAVEDHIKFALGRSAIRSRIDRVVEQMFGQSDERNPAFQVRKLCYSVNSIAENVGHPREEGSNFRISFHWHGQNGK